MKKNHIEDGRILPVLNEIAKKTGATPIEMTTKQNHIGDDHILPVLESIRDSIGSGGGSSAGVMSSAVSELVEEIIITEENQRIIFDNLDAIRDGGYTFVIESTESTLPTTSLSIYLNDDKTITNYTRSWSGAYSTGEVSVGNEDTSIFMDIRNGCSAYCIAEVSFSGKVLSTQYNSDNSLLDIGMCKKDILTNVTKIEIVGNNGVTIGTKMSLYKRKTEVKPSLVKEVILDVDTTSVVFDNLDAVSDGGYELVLESGVASQVSKISMYFNDDIVASNYSRGASSLVVGSETPIITFDSTSIFFNVQPNNKSFARVDISTNGFIQSTFSRTDQNSTLFSIFKNDRPDNVTKIELLADVAGGIPAGTTLSLYRRKSLGVDGGGTYDPTKDNEQDTRLDVIETEQITQNDNITELQNRPVADVDKVYVDTADANLQIQIDELKSRPIGTGNNLSANVLLQEIIVAEDTTSVVFDNLDAIADGGYELVFDSSVGKMQSNLQMFFNDDTTVANYSRSFGRLQKGVSENPTVIFEDTAVFSSVDLDTNSFTRADISHLGYVKSFLVRGDDVSVENYVSKKQALDNVTKIEIKSDIDNAIIAGSKFSLYKRKTEIKTNLVEEIKVDTDTTSIVFDNLDAIADGGYELVLESGLASQATTICMYLNDDIVDTNYSRMLSNCNTGALTPEIAEDSIPVFCNVENNEKSFVVVDISTNGFIKSSMSRNATRLTEFSIFKNEAPDNINKIEIKANVDNGIPAGTTVTLYRRKFESVVSPTVATSEAIGVSYQLGDIILQNSEWTNDFVEVDGMTFVKCNQTVVSGSSYPFITECNLAVSLESVKKVINMTSNNTPAPYVTSSNDVLTPNEAAWKAFNGVENVLGWGDDHKPCWLRIYLGEEISISAYDVNFISNYSYDTDSAPRDWTFQGSNDGTNWTTLDTRTGQTGWVRPSTRHFVLAEPQSSSWYRINITANNGSVITYVGEISLYVSGYYETPTLYITEPETTQNIYYYMRIK